MSGLEESEMGRRNIGASERRLCVFVAAGFVGFGKTTVPKVFARRPDGCDALS